jgi:YD repeat-containing protein
MQRTARPRHYIWPGLLAVMRPFLRYNYSRGAYVLRIAGERWGPVLREDQRRHQLKYDGHDRRHQVIDAAASSLGRTA